MNKLDLWTGLAFGMVGSLFLITLLTLCFDIEEREASKESFVIYTEDVAVMTQFYNGCEAVGGSSSSSARHHGIRKLTCRYPGGKN